MTWTIIGTISSVIGAVAAVLAAYFAYPRKVRRIDVGVESVKRLPGDCEWEIEFSVANLDYNTVLNDAMVCINTRGLEPLRIVPKNQGGLWEMPDMVLEADSVTFSIEKMKPRTKRTGIVEMKAKPGSYNLTWCGYGANLRDKKGSVMLDLADGEDAS